MIALKSRPVYASLSAGVRTPADSGKPNGTLGDALRSAMLRSGKQITAKVA